MEQFDAYYEDFEEQFQRFERAAAKAHEESIWILSVVQDVKMEVSALKEAFAKTEQPLGWYFAGELSRRREQFEYYKKSAEGGCSWGQVGYGDYFRCGKFVEKDEKVYLEWVEKAVNQNNAEAKFWLGDWYRQEGEDKQKAVSSCFLEASELGWKSAMCWLAIMLRDGFGCAKDLRQAVIWGAKGGAHAFWNILADAARALESRSTEDLDCDFDQLCYSLGWGLYWYQYGSADWQNLSGNGEAFAIRCLDYYCSCVELQQKSIFMFLLFWNRTTGGVKGPGQMVAEMVWEGREDNLVKLFEWKDEGWGCVLF
jgi:hypothetical protein